MKIELVQIWITNYDNKVLKIKLSPLAEWYQGEGDWLERKTLANDAWYQISLSSAKEYIKIYQFNNIIFQQRTDKNM